MYDVDLGTPWADAARRRDLRRDQVSRPIWTSHSFKDLGDAGLTRRAAIDNGSNLLNSSAFYGMPPNRLANLELLNRFYEKYPAYAGKTVICVKGGINWDTHHPTGKYVGRAQAALKTGLTSFGDELKAVPTSARIA